MQNQKFFETINKIGKFSLDYGRKEDAGTKIWSENGNITTGIIEITGIIKKTIWTIVCQQIKYPRWNGNFSRKRQITKTDSTTNWNLSRPIIDWINNWKPPNKEKFKTRWLHEWTPLNIERRIKTCTSQTLSEK